MGFVNSDRPKSYLALYNILIVNCLIDYTGQNSIFVSHADHITIKNTITSRSGWDLEMDSWSSNINFITCVGKDLNVEGCISFHAVDVSDKHTDGNGMIMDVHAWEVGNFDPGGVVKNSLFFENGGAGIAWTNSNDATIINNTLWNNGIDLSYIHPNTGLVFCNAPENVIIKNNIVAQRNGTSGLVDACGNKLNSPIVQSNLISGQGEFGDLQFANMEEFDFRLKSESVGVDEGTTGKGVPAYALGWDSKVLKEQTTDQPIPWFHIAPDLDYIISKGGIANCFKKVPRPQGKGVDIGAFEVH